MTDDRSPFPLGHGSVTVVTKRGRTVHIRHIDQEDAALLVDLFHRLSPATRRLRFFSPMINIPEDQIWSMAQRLSAIDPLDEAALIATILEDVHERAVGVARLVRDGGDPTTAEVAIVLRDDYQGEGLGPRLFDLLLQIALVRGLKRLWAISLAENSAFHHLVHNSGLPFTSQTRSGETTTTITLSDT
jgi:RimJ/RimL family protein N-acetyltransferase